MAERPRRIGVLTGGGDCPGLNAVVRAVVKAARSEDWEPVGIFDGFEGLLRPNGARPLTERDVRGILPRGGTILGTTNRGIPSPTRLKGTARPKRSIALVTSSAGSKTSAWTR